MDLKSNLQFVPDFALLTVLFAGLFLGSACRRHLPYDQQPIENVLAPVLEPGDGGIKVSKLDQTIRCFNMATRTNQSVDAYFNRAGTNRSGPKRTPDSMLQPYPDTHSVCLKAAHDTSVVMPQIDRIMHRYVERLRAVHVTIETMDEYYRHQQPTKDRLRRGKQLHKTIISQHQEFMELHHELANAIDQQADVRDEQSIKQQCCESSNLYYQALLFQRTAKKLARELSKDDLSESRFEVLKDELQSSYDSMVQCADNHPLQVDETFMFPLFRMRSRSFVRAVKQSDASSLRAIHVTKMLASYNELLEASNQLRWKQPQADYNTASPQAVP